MNDTDTAKTVAEIVSAHPAGRGSLIPILQDIQEKFSCLSEEVLEELSGLTNISENEIYGVSTFYTQFRFRPPGEHTIRVCQGTACHVRGAKQVLGEVEKRLDVEAGETTQDGRFDVERVACIGCCALAPTVTVDEEVYARMTTTKVKTLIDDYAVKK